MARPQEFTVQQVIDAIPGTGGIQALVAKKLQCDRATVCRYAQRYVTVREALAQEDEGLTDLAEAKAVKLIEAEHWPAIQHRLATKGKRRGYSERQEVDVTSGGKSITDLVKELATLERRTGAGSPAGS